MAEEKHVVKILSIASVTHDVRRIKLEKPEGYSFVPGQATEVAVNKEGWKEKAHPFTFTSLNDWDHLEFTIKIYDDHRGVTHQIGQLKTGDELIIHDVWGAIQYKGEGTFIAGGAGVTPFIAIFRQLNKDNEIGENRLIFSNKTAKDIILKEEFEEILGDRFVNTLTQEEVEGYDHQRLSTDYLKEKIGGHIDQHFYICGPDAMISTVQTALDEIGISEDTFVIEE